MAFSMFEACVPACVQILGSMSTVIDKAAAHCAEKKYDEVWMLNDRLFPDMFTLPPPITSCAIAAWSWANATSLVRSDETIRHRGAENPDRRRSLGVPSAAVVNSAMSLFG